MTHSRLTGSSDVVTVRELKKKTGTSDDPFRDEQLHIFFSEQLCTKC